jgi:hypothetical protein
MIKKLIYSAILILTLVSCSTPPVEITPSPTSEAPTPFPLTATPTAQLATDTPDAEAPESDKKPIVLGNPILVSEGGFSIRPISDYPVFNTAREFAQQDPDRQLVLSFAGGQISKDLPLDSFFDSYLESLTKNIANLEHTEIEAVIFREKEGLETQISGFEGGTEIEGHLMIIQFTRTKIFLALGYGRIGEESNAWQESGQQTYDALLSSVAFLGVDENCKVSEDTTYGYTPENPIRIGGGEVNGNQRIIFFLQNLTNPQGESIRFSSAGILQTEDILIIQYEIYYSGLANPVLLYFDIATPEALKAPYGLGCLIPFDEA